MKRLIIISIIILMSTTLFAASISMPAATVRLTRTQQISMSDLDKEVAKYKASSSNPESVDPLKVLDLLVNNELFRQGAERDGVKITPATARRYQTTSLTKSLLTTLVVLMSTRR